MRTTVGIVGAGPAGLMLAHLLAREGIESVILEDRSRAYCEARRRAGLMEHWVAQLMIETGVGARLQREAMVHDGVYLGFEGAVHHVDFHRLIGQRVVVYDQKEVVTDLIAHRLAQGGRILFETSDVVLHDIDSANPSISFRHDGKAHRLDCDFIAGCDGFHGIARPTIAMRQEHERIYPFGWLGILAEAPPPEKELIYCWHERGFALFSMRGPDLARLYIQCDPDTDAASWSDEAIWDELETRLGGARSLMRGRIVQKGVTAMRSFVCETMQQGRLFLAGDAAHIVPPTGAKGMNLAMADVRVLASALAAAIKRGDETALKGYGDTCLRRIWKAQRFSWWMTTLMHIEPERRTFDMRRQRAELDYLVHSTSAKMSFAENYCGLPFETADGDAAV